jgi:hypothetical protein
MLPNKNINIVMNIISLYNGHIARVRTHTFKMTNDTTSIHNLHTLNISQNSFNVRYFWCTGLQLTTIRSTNIQLELSHIVWQVTHRRPMPQCPRNIFRFTDFCTAVDSMAFLLRSYPNRHPFSITYSCSMHDMIRPLYYCLCTQWNWTMETDWQD